MSETIPNLWIAEGEECRMRAVTSGDTRVLEALDQLRSGSYSTNEESHTMRPGSVLVAASVGFAFHPDDVVPQDRQQATHPQDTIQEA